MTEMAHKRPKRMRAWRQEEEDYLIDNYKRLTIKDISEHVKRSEGAVLSRANLLGLKRRIVIREYHDRVVKMAAEGKNNAEISREIGVSTGAMYDYFKENKLEIKQNKKVPYSRIAIQNGIDDPIITSLNNMTAKEWYVYWYQTYRSSSIRAVSKTKYRGTFGVLCTHPLADKLLADVTRGDAQEYLNWYGEKRSKQTVYDHWQMIRSCFNDAVLDGLIKVNPFVHLKAVYLEQSMAPKELKAQRDQKKWLEVDEYTKLKYHLMFWFNEALTVEPMTHEQGVQNSLGLSVSLQPSYAVIFVALKTGARLSEVLGLTESDILMDTNEINVDKTWDYKTGKGFVQTKNTASIRKIPVDKDTIDILRRYIYWLGRFEIETDGNTLFNFKGVKTYNSSLNNRLKSLLESLDMQPITMHKLRHTQASMLIASGVPLQLVAKRLGHTNATMIQRVYGHLLEQTEEDGNKMIMRLL